MYNHPLTIAVVVRDRQHWLLTDVRSARVRRDLRRIRAAKTVSQVGVVTRDQVDSGTAQVPLARST